MTAKISRDILVFAHPQNSNDQELTRSSYRLIALAQTLTTGRVIVALPAGVAPELVPASEVAHTYQLENPLGADRWEIGSVLAQSLHSLIEEEGLSEVGPILLPSTNWGKEAAAQLGYFRSAGASVDVTNVEINPAGEVIAEKSILGGTWQSSFGVSGRTPVLAIRGVSLPAEIQDAGDRVAEAVANGVAAATATVFTVTEKAATSRIKVVSRSSAENELGNVGEAAVAVCGGRGTHGDFAPVYALAKALGGAVGATRVACEEGWIDRSAQVGQSGVAIAPNLYIGLGISGDPHHTCGIRGAQRIVAVCDDPQAAIFRLCDFGIVGDLQTVVQQTLDLLAARRGA